jgi:predicted  nucleic acid-binding Zn-ribbon protein
METADKIKILREIYEKDKEIDKIKNLEKKVPKQIKEFGDALEDFKKNFEKEKKFFDDIDERRRELEKIIDEKKLNLENFNRRKKESHTNEEFVILQGEIEKTEEAISKTEDELLEVYFEKDEAKKKMDDARSIMEEKIKSFEQKEEALKKELDGSKEGLIIKEDEKKRIIARLKDENLFRKYSRIKDSRGTGASIIEDSECTECHSTIPPQLFAEVRKGNRVIVCQSCGRILIYRWIE